MISEMLDLDEADIIIYSQVAQQFECTIDHLVKVTRIPENEVRRSVARLVDTGLACSEQVGRYRATLDGPKTLVERLRTEVDIEYGRQRSKLTNLQSELTGLLKRYSTLSSIHAGPSIDRISNPETSNIWIAELMCGTRHEILRVRRPRSPQQARQDEAAEEKALDRGIAVRAIYPTIMTTDVRFRGQLIHQLHAGAQLRAVPDPPVDMLVLDRQVGVLSEEENDGGPGGKLILRGRSVVGALHALFESCWSQSSNIGSYIGADPDRESVCPLEPADFAMISLLSGGAKDEVVAREMGVSVRTVRRRISEILHVLNASSRFQMGVLAVRHGWL